jgi:predicted nucleic acid-binding protein
VIHGPLVFDTSALFNFGHRDTLLGLLKQLKAENLLVAPSAVVEELVPERRYDYASMRAGHFVTLAPKPKLEDLERMRRLSAVLGRGEVEVILLAQEVQGMAVLDDRAARRVAEQLGVEATGTLGLIAHGIDRGWMTDAEAMRAVRQLRANGFFVPRVGDDEHFDAYLGRLGRL